MGVQSAQHLLRAQADLDITGLPGHAASMNGNGPAWAAQHGIELKLASAMAAAAHVCQLRSDTAMLHLLGGCVSALEEQNIEVAACRLCVRR